jgi:periplasmic protein TonB
MRHAAHRDGLFGAGAAQRIALAIVLSLAAHASAIWVIRAGPPKMALGTRTIEARILSVPERTEPEPAPEAPQPDRSVSIAPSAHTRDPSPAAETRSEGARAPEPIAIAPVQRAGRDEDVPLASDPIYHLITALDRPPAPLSAPDVCFPTGAAGEVTYELLIDETGVVNAAAVLSADPHGLPTARAAERCRALRFSPAIKDGRAVRSKVRLVVGTQ